MLARSADKAGRRRQDLNAGHRSEQGTVFSAQHVSRWRGAFPGALGRRDLSGHGHLALDAEIGVYSAKGSGKLSFLRILAVSFPPGDVMLADAVYCNYFMVAAVVKTGVNVLEQQRVASTNVPSRISSPSLASGTLIVPKIRRLSNIRSDHSGGRSEPLPFGTTDPTLRVAAARGVTVSTSARTRSRRDCRFLALYSRSEKLIGTRMLAKTTAGQLSQATPRPMAAMINKSVVPLRYPRKPKY